MSIEFNGPSKLASLSAGTTTLNVVDLWSRWSDWMSQADNSKFLPMFSSVGGDVIDPSAGTAIPLYIFVQNGWRIKPQEAHHTLSGSGGVIVVSAGGDPFANTVGNFNVRINYSLPVQAIAIAGGSGGLTLSEIEGSTVLAKEMTAARAAENAELAAFGRF